MFRPEHRSYCPDGWVFLEKTYTDTGEKYYSIFGCWWGGFSSGDSWKLSSGMTKEVTCRQHGEHESFNCPQESGSTYLVSFTVYNRLNSYSLGVLSSLIDSADSIPNLKVRVIEEDEAKEIMKGFLKDGN